MAGQDAPFPDLGGLTFSEDVFYRLLDDFLSVGVVGSATDYQVIQNHLGANMSVDVNPGSAYVAIANGGKRRTRLPAQSNSGIPGTPNSADNWTTTFVAADPTNPRVDRVVLTAQDSSIDGSGFYRSILRVVAGTPTSGATLVNLNGAAAVPANSILLANVLVPNSATTVTTANISDQRPISKVGAGNAAINANPPITYRKSTPKIVNTTVAATDLLNGEITIAAGVMGATGKARLTANGDWLQNASASNVMPRFQLMLGGTTLIDTGANTRLAGQSATRLMWRLVAEITNTATGAQNIAFLLELASIAGGAGAVVTTFATGTGIFYGGAATGNTMDAYAKGYNTSALDTTTAKTLVLNVINGNAGALYETKLTDALVEII